MTSRVKTNLTAALLTLFIPLSFVQSCLGADEVMAKKIRIDGIYYFGYAGLDLAKTKECIPLKVGDEIDQQKWMDYKIKIANAVKALLGKPSSDEALVGTDQKYIVFIGLPGTSNRSTDNYLPVPTETIPVPEKIRQLYKNEMDALVIMIDSGKQEDTDKYNALHAELKAAAAKNQSPLMKSLEGSSSAEDRMVAAHALGQVVSTDDELKALVKAARDSNSTVRNNAIRALGVLFLEKPELAKQIPSAYFVELLNSPTWSDRNKGMFVVNGLSKSRDPKFLAELKSHALDSLKEMCIWPEGYSGAPMAVIGRIAGIPEERLGRLLDERNSAEIFSALK